MVGNQPQTVAEAWTRWQPQTPASGAVALAESSAPLQMMAGADRGPPWLLSALLALLVCLGELVDADSKPQPSGEKASWEKHHFSLSHYAKLPAQAPGDECAGWAGAKSYDRGVITHDPAPFPGPAPGLWI